jgi:hypothetical protein
MANSIICKGQDYTLTLETGLNLTAMVTTIIQYKKPGATTSVNLNASVLLNTKLRVNISRTINNVHGEWRFRAYAVTASNRVYKGTVARLKVEDDWTI